jgi:uncharacterized membrane protein YidH (DUF202 family)
MCDTYKTVTWTATAITSISFALSLSRYGCLIHHRISLAGFLHFLHFSSLFLAVTIIITCIFINRFKKQS